MNFYDRLRLLCKERNTNVSTMLKDLGMSTGCTGNWSKGQLPKGEVLAMISEYLDTSIDYIVFGKYNYELTDDEKKLLELYSQTPERAKYKVLCDLEKIVAEEIEKLAKEKGAV